MAAALKKAVHASYCMAHQAWERRWHVSLQRELWQRASCGSTDLKNLLEDYGGYS
jgi:uncharacterized protein YmfQ (DUF2313 family)